MADTPLVRSGSSVSGWDHEGRLRSSGAEHGWGRTMRVHDLPGSVPRWQVARRERPSTGAGPGASSRGWGPARGMRVPSAAGHHPEALGPTPGQAWRAALLRHSAPCARSRLPGQAPSFRSQACRRRMQPAPWVTDTARSRGPQGRSPGSRSRRRLRAGEVPFHVKREQEPGSWWRSRWCGHLAAFHVEQVWFVGRHTNRRGVRVSNRAVSVSPPGDGLCTTRWTRKGCRRDRPGIGSLRARST